MSLDKKISVNTDALSTNWSNSSWFGGYASAPISYSQAYQGGFLPFNSYTGNTGYFLPDSSSNYFSNWNFSYNNSGFQNFNAGRNTSGWNFGCGSSSYNLDFSIGSNYGYTGSSSYSLGGLSNFGCSSLDGAGSRFDSNNFFGYTSLGNVSAARRSSSLHQGDFDLSYRHYEGTGLGAAIAAKARSFVDRVNSDAEGNRLFSGGRNQAWCQDFVSWTLGHTSDKFPRVMTTTSSPITFRNEADRRGCYYRMPSSNRKEWILANVKPGDVVVKDGKGASGLHVAIVTEVKSDGTIVVASGNSSDAVKERNYGLNTTIYGIVDVEKLAAQA